MLVHFPKILRNLSAGNHRLIEWIHNCEVAFEELEEELKTQSQVSNVLADEPKYSLEEEYDDPIVAATEETESKFKGEIKEMTNEIKVFNFKENQVRTVVKDGEPWFVVKDVCDVLELSNSRMAMERLDEDEKGVSPIDTRGGRQTMQTVNEYGLYSLILGSRKPEAKEFKRWITHEVIPSIRKHGAYMTPSTLDEFIANPNFGIKLLTSLQEEREARKALELQSAQQQKVISELEPKATHYDQWINGTGYYSKFLWRNFPL